METVTYPLEQFTEDEQARLAPHFTNLDRPVFALVNKGAEFAPVQACCGVCRTCVTTNVLTLALAGVTGAAVYLTRGIRRLLARTQ